jgi:tetraacyldisaccharide 4'-kinase
MPAISRNNLSILMYPFSLLYGLVISIRNLFYDHNIFRSHEFPIPIISVGNITVGGTGKTPQVEYLVGMLTKQFNVAVLSRGYKRKTRHFILAGTESGVNDIGDEPVQIKRKYPKAHVAVDRRRVNGVEMLMEKIPGLDVILLDDAYQHRHIKPGLSILLIDYNRPITRDRLLPVGRLRENAREKRRANIILVTKCPDRLKTTEQQKIARELKLHPYQHLYFTKLLYKDPVPIFKDAEPGLHPTEIKTSGPDILMVTGIADPRPFQRHMRSISPGIVEMIYPDHYHFRQRDIDDILRTYRSMKGENRFIFTTEKDAVRLRKFVNIDVEIKNRFFYIPIEIDFLNEDRGNFNHQILNYVSGNKRDGILH